MPNLQETREILDNPVNKQKISKALIHEKQLRFHTKPNISPVNNEILLNFKRWVRSFLPKDKFDAFEKLMVFPLDTVKITDEAYKALKKVFDAKNPVYDYQFLRDDDLSDWNEYRDQIKDQDYWSTKGFENFKYRINSFIVVDIPTEQESEKPEPYYYTVDLSKVIDFELKYDKVEWIIFKISDELLASYDNEAYRVFKVKEKTTDIISLEVENFHDLGYCPARLFWTDSIDSNEYFFKISSLTNHLSILDWILFFSIAARYNELYASYPIYWGFETDCDYNCEFDKGIYQCDGGLLKNDVYGYMIDRTGKHVKCPKCEDKISGPGTFVEVPIPDGDFTGVTPPVGRIDVDKSSLDYNVERIDKYIQDFHQAVTGSNYDVITTQAVNKDQVFSIFESRKNILVDLKKNFELIISWTHKTMAKIRYGESFVRCSIDMGTEWFLFSEDVLLDMYNKAKESYQDTVTLDYIQDQYFETKFKNNPTELMRTQIVKALDPFRHLSNSEVTNMYNSGSVTFEDYMMKVNLSSLIMRFEREYMDIVNFGRIMSFDKKIEKIKEIIATKYIVKPEVIAS